MLAKVGKWAILKKLTIATILVLKVKKYPQIWIKKVNHYHIKMDYQIFQFHH
ncbi:hypothetical protein ES705_11904 [subsurface metagenome]